MKYYIEIDLGNGVMSPHWPIQNVMPREELIDMVTRDTDLIFAGYDKNEVRTAQVNLISINNSDWNITPICTINNNLTYVR